MGCICRSEWLKMWSHRDGSIEIFRDNLKSIIKISWYMTGHLRRKHLLRIKTLKTTMKNKESLSLSLWERWEKKRQRLSLIFENNQLVTSIRWNSSDFYFDASNEQWNESKKEDTRNETQWEKKQTQTGSHSNEKLHILSSKYVIG